MHPPIPNKDSPLHFYQSFDFRGLRTPLETAIKQTNSSINLTSFTFSDKQIIELLDQKNRDGCLVEAHFDPKYAKPNFNSPYIVSSYQKRSKLYHRKIVILDSKIVFIGSANFTFDSLTIHDNLVCGIYNKKLALSLLKGESYEDNEIHCYLFPKDNTKALKELITLINNAKISIDIALFTLTHPKLIYALEGALKRGVSINLHIDQTHARTTAKKALSALRKLDANIYTNRTRRTLHHKTALIDKQVLIIGSANWTKNAFHRNEEILCIFYSLSKKQKNYFKKFYRSLRRRTEKTA